MEKPTKVSTQSFQETRRRLLIKSAKAAPVITALASVPVWATQRQASGNYSVGMSGATKQGFVANGASPGFWSKKEGKKKRFRKSSYDPCKFDNNNRLPNHYYEKYFGGITGIFPDSHLNKKLEYVLSPSNWDKNNGDVSQLDRYMITAYLNADPDYGIQDFPYGQSEVKMFAKHVYTGSIHESEALVILKNLVHEGFEDMPDAPRNCEI